MNLLDLISHPSMCLNDVANNLDVYKPLYQTQDGGVLIVPYKVYAFGFFPSELHIEMNKAK